MTQYREALRCFLNPQGVMDAISHGMSVEDMGDGAYLVSGTPDSLKLWKNKMPPEGAAVIDVEEINRQVHVPFGEVNGDLESKISSTHKIIEEIISSQPEEDKKILTVVITELLDFTADVRRIANALERIADIQKEKSNG